MPVEVKVPTLGESVVEATVGRWRKQAGELVSRGETLVEVETDKVTVDIAAEQSGTLTKILRAEGDNVAIGETIALITASASQPDSLPGNERPEPTSPARTDVSASPVARKIAEENKLDLATVHGSGSGGKITRQDVESHLQQPTEIAEPVANSSAVSEAPAETLTLPDSDARPTERRHMDRRRQTIARNLVDAQHNAAMLTTFNEVDMGPIMELRTRYRDAFKEAHGVGLGFMSFFVQASVSALKAFPLVNAEISGDEILVKKYYDIGVAVGTEKGLVVPVIRAADQKSLAAIERDVVDLALRAREDKLTLDDIKYGTFTITNGGIYGSLMSTPILNAPQVAILGMHAIKKRPVSVDDQVVVRPMMYLALSYDHRIVDGSEAVRFLVHIKTLVEDPAWLLLQRP